MTCSSAPDQTRIDDLYAQHSGWLRQWLTRRFGNSFNTADVADLTHDTFLRLLLKPRVFRLPGEARSFLCTVARGLCIDQWRRGQIEQAWLTELANRPENLHPSPSTLPFFSRHCMKSTPCCVTCRTRREPPFAGATVRQHLPRDCRTDWHQRAHGEKVHGTGHVSVHGA